MSSWIRWRVAELLDLFSDTCWADLCMWAYFPELHPFREIFKMRGRAGQCERMGEVPYCGKCEKDRRQKYPDCPDCGAEQPDGGGCFYCETKPEDA